MKNNGDTCDTFLRRELAGCPIKPITCINRMLRYHRKRREKRKMLWSRQRGKSALAPYQRLTKKTTELDHIWTFEKAAKAVFSGKMIFADAYNRVWKDSNLRLITKKQNNARRKRRLLTNGY